MFDFVVEAFFVVAVAVEVRERVADILQRLRAIDFLVALGAVVGLDFQAMRAMAVAALGSVAVSMVEEAFVLLALILIGAIGLCTPAGCACSRPDYTLLVNSHLCQADIKN